MTFLKLNKNDFTKTKLTHKSHIEYDSESLEFSRDFSLNSKNVVNTEFIIDLPILEKVIVKWNEHVTAYNAKYSAKRSALVLISEVFNVSQKQSIVDNLNIFRESLKSVKERTLTDNDGEWNQLRSLSEADAFSPPVGINIPDGFVNYAISELFTINDFKIKRVGQKFLPYSDELAKKNFIRDKLYRYYQDQIADADHKNVSYTFTNYNTLNFCKIGSANPSNAVVYPNPYSSSSSVHGYEFLDSNNFNISFWINKRQTDNIDKPQCLLHIPHFLSIYTVDTDANKYSFVLKAGQLANELFRIQDNNSQLKERVRNDNLIDLNNTFFDDNAEIFGGFVNFDVPITFNNDLSFPAEFTNSLGVYGNEKLFANNWHNVSINFLTNDTSALVLFYIDGQFIGRNIISKTNENGNNPRENHSLIMLGNKLSYDTAANFNSIYTQFFAKVKNNSALGPYYNKDVSLGLFDDYIDNDPIDFDNIDSKWSRFEVRFTQHFEGEVHDIRIYKQNISNEKIKDIYKNIVSDLDNEINNFELDFYVPVLYVPAEVSKKTSINLYGSESSSPAQNIPKQYYYKFNHIYNPILANYCGGLELSIENYLIEFVKEVKPNIVIESKNIVNNTNATSFYNGITDYLTFKGIKNSVSFSKSDFQKGQILFEEFYGKAESLNAKYYNSLILPNDNGIPNCSYNSIEYLINNASTLNINTKFYYLQKLYSKINLTNTQNLPKSRNSAYPVPPHDYFIVNKSINYFNTNLTPANNSNLAEENINFDVDTNYQSTNDLIYDISNYYYHKGAFDDDIISHKKGIFDSVYDTSNNNAYTKSNPVDRDFFSETGSIVANDSITVDDGNIELYEKHSLPYFDINYEDCNFFNVYFDITNNLYGDKISPNSFVFINNDLSYRSSLILKDNGESGVYRANCLTKQAKWNIVGNLFYNEGILNINNPVISYIGLDNFKIECKGENNVFVSEINLSLKSGKFDNSNNVTHDIDLRHDTNGVNSTESFVYITDINLHDENYNIIANAKMAHPIPKKPSDKFTIRLKMDY